MILFFPHMMCVEASENLLMASRWNPELGGYKIAHLMTLHLTTWWADVDSSFTVRLVWCSREGNGNLLQYSCLENPMDGGTWWAAVHGVAKSWARLSDFTFSFHFHALEKEMATHSSILAWRIPGTEEPSWLLSLRSHRVGHDWSNLAAAAVWCSVHHRGDLSPPWRLR